MADLEKSTATAPPSSQSPRTPSWLERDVEIGAALFLPWVDKALAGYCAHLADTTFKDRVLLNDTLTVQNVAVAKDTVMAETKRLKAHERLLGRREATIHWGGLELGIVFKSLELELSAREGAQCKTILEPALPHIPLFKLLIGKQDTLVEVKADDALKDRYTKPRNKFRDYIQAQPPVSPQGLKALVSARSRALLKAFVMGC